MEQTLKNVDKNIFELQSDALTFLLFIGYAICAVLAVLILASQHFQEILPVGAVAVLLFASHMIKKRDHYTQAAWLSILAVIVGCILETAINGPSPSTYYFFILVVIAANLILEPVSYTHLTLPTIYSV